jgi:hypothetical protein
MDTNLRRVLKNVDGGKRLKVYLPAVFGRFHQNSEDGRDAHEFHELALNLKEVG